MVKKKDLPVPGQRDKKGIPVLTDEHDLYEIFGVKKKSKDEDFARMLEEPQDERSQRLWLKEKETAAPKPRPLTVRERIKSYPAPQSELDLHGNTGAEAAVGTEAFIRNAGARGIRTVRIIVGKGLHSEKKAVLPEVVERKILELKRQKKVLDFNWEKKDKRKSGALIVYLLLG